MSNPKPQKFSSTVVLSCQTANFMERKGSKKKKKKFDEPVKTIGLPVLFYEKKGKKKHYLKLSMFHCHIPCLFRMKKTSRKRASDPHDNSRSRRRVLRRHLTDFQQIFTWFCSEILILTNFDSNSTLVLFPKLK